MTEDVIVIPTFNGKEYIEKLMDNMPTDTDILIIDTGGNAENFNWLCSLPDTYPEHSIKIDRTPYRGRPYGALLWAYWMYPEYKGFMLMHDTLEIIEQDFLHQFKAIMPRKGCVAWILHSFFFDNESQGRCLKYLYGNETPPYLIFGPIFYTNRESLDDLYNKDLLPAYPMNKHQDQGIERGIAMVFYHAGMQIETLCGTDGVMAIPGTTLTNKVFKKTWAARK